MGKLDYRKINLKALIPFAHSRIFLIKLSNCIKRERALLKYTGSIQEKHLTKRKRKIKKIRKIKKYVNLYILRNNPVVTEEPECSEPVTSEWVLPKAMGFCHQVGLSC